MFYFSPLLFLLLMIVGGFISLPLFLFLTVVGLPFVGIFGVGLILFRRGFTSVKPSVS